MAIGTLELAYVKSLEAAGVERKVAEAHAAFRRALSEDSVSKGHFDIRMAERKADTDARFADVRSELLLLKWMAGFNLALSAGILMKLLS